MRKVRYLKETVMSRRTKTGFTLVELLVVISIIALLLGILLPALNKVRSQGKKVVCSSNLRQIGFAFRAYGQDFQDWIIVAKDPRATLSSGSFVGQEAWNFALLKYVAKNRTDKNGFDAVENLWFCPEDKDPYPKGYGSFSSIHGEALTSYAENGLYIYNGRSGTLKLGPAGGYRFEEVRSPSSAMLLLETSYFFAVYDWDSPAIQKYGGIVRDGHHRLTTGFYHSGAVNVLFADSHAGPIKGKTVPPYADYNANGRLKNFTQANMYFPTLSLPSSTENRVLWGPGY